MTVVTMEHQTAVPSVEPRTPGIQEYAGVLLFFALCLCLFGHLREAGLPGGIYQSAAAAFAGFVAADLFSGLVHWAFDTWGAPTTPVLGRMFIVPFRIHHRDPKEITYHGFVATNGHNCLATFPILLGALALPADTEWGAATAIFLASVCLGTFGTNQFHKWAHQDEVPLLIRWVQRSGLILSPEHHAIHHRAPYDGHYCITTGWMNPLLGRLNFFRRAERVVTAATGRNPRVDDLGRS